jgi:hypothetical protein
MRADVDSATAYAQQTLLLLQFQQRSATIEKEVDMDEEVDYMETLTEQFATELDELRNVSSHSDS